MTRMAVMTTIIENTPTRTPSSVRAERSLCAARALIAMRKLSRNSASNMEVRLTLMADHSFLNASTGFMRAARQAGRNPDTIPVSKETSSARPTMLGERFTGKNLRTRSVSSQAMARAMAPPIRQMVGRLDQELQQDGAALGADGLADADLARPLRHRDEHDVHDADAADKEREARDEQADRGDDPRHPMNHLEELGPAG